MYVFYFRMSANYYVSRDPRREVAHPVSLSQKLIGGDGTKRFAKKTKILQIKQI